MYSFEEKRNEQIENRKRYYISSDPSGIEQVNEHLTYDDLFKFFSGRYDDNLSEEQCNELLNDASLLRKIRHVEICSKCMQWCVFGYDLRWDLTGGAISLPKEKFFMEFKETWDRLEKKQQAKEKICAINGHNFGCWSHNLYRTMTDSPFDNIPIKDGKYLHEIWKRKCSCCGLEEKTLEDPEKKIKSR